MANAEGDEDVSDAEPQEGENEAREMNDWMVKQSSKILKAPPVLSI